MEKLKVLELCEFSAGICGVWARVRHESLEFIEKGFEVRVFSSDVVKGTNGKAENEEEIERIKIHRFKSNGSWISENVKYWFIFGGAKEELEKYNPDIIITHLLHPYTANLSTLIRKLKLKKPNLKVFVVPHAPFNVDRGFILNLATNLWRKLSTLNLNNFDRIIAITKWEMPYLEKLGVRREKVVYIPNGLPKEFFTEKRIKSEKGKDVLFLGRIAPVKNLETLLLAAKQLPNINFSIVGTAEEEYLNKIKRIITKESLANVKVYPPVYNLKEKIKLIDKHKIFVLPSVREAMPQVLLEAMARGKIVISSKTDGGKEIIEDYKNGILFEIGNYNKLADLIKQNINGSKKMQAEAIKEAKKYAWSKLIKHYIDLIKK